jgi:hypothetical protein
MTEETKPKRKTTTSKAVRNAYAKRRLDALNKSAILAGYNSWRELEKEVYKGAGVTIPARKVE